ncbi:zinc-binding alcohol dehydrogenase family protein [Gryllotalpicola reticulitermitis]|uniref:Zinc-binding alcohol dehydrogenase family protein n=1 Tax=Gryllotalpicola reticulitermitis TaxID=1184153 RepID=A0ABV8Q948_9MICO
MPEQNTALWLRNRFARLTVGPAPYTPPGPGEIVVRVRAVGLNLVDSVSGVLLGLVAPWLKFPAVLGGDVAGDVVEVGAGVTRFHAGDRILGLALGLERSQNRPAEGAFQNFAVLMEHMVSPIPETMSFEQAAVLPLQLATAATGLFQQDHLGLALPTANPPERPETVLVWGGSTGVGSNAIQLARGAGYRVVATASPRNFEYLRTLGAAATVDRNSATAVDELVAAIGDSPLAGSLAIGNGSVRPVMQLAARAPGTKRVASAAPAFVTRLQSRGAKRLGVQVSGIWGGTLKDNEVGPAVFVDLLPAALATGAYRSAPDAEVVGHGLDAIPAGLKQLRRGVSAKKLVVTL